MNKIIISLVLIFTASFAIAGGHDKNKNSSEITPATEISDEKSFNVEGLAACEVEGDDEDGIEEFIETASTVSELILLTEDLEESEVVDFN